MAENRCRRVRIPAPNFSLVYLRNTGSVYEIGRQEFPSTPFKIDSSYVTLSFNAITSYLKGRKVKNKYVIKINKDVNIGVGGNVVVETLCYKS
jgi:hypothetical protein